MKAFTFMFIATILVGIGFYVSNKWNESISQIPSHITLINKFYAVNSYLYPIPNTNKYILIDTLVEGEHDYIVSQLKSHGISLNQVALIFHTHCHGDHTGSTAALLNTTKIPVYLHPSEIDIVKNGLGMPMPKSTIFLFNYSRNWVPAQKVPRFEPSMSLEFGKSIAEYGGIKIMHTPGHSTGSTTLITKEGDCFIGDLMGSAFLSLNSAGYPMFYENLQTIYTNIQKMQKEECKWFYVGHGLPFDHRTLTTWLAENKLPSEY